LRIQAFEELTETSEVVGDYDLWVKSVLVKMKPIEFGKFNKYSRCIGDFGVKASLLGFRNTDFLKRAMSMENVEINGGVMAFCKSPDPVELKKHFDLLHDPPGRFYFLYFSDDSCLAIRNPVTGRVDWYNLDISSCDASHGPGMFGAYSKLYPDGHPRHDAQRLVSQCELPVRINSVSDPTNVLRLKANRPILYSGSTITTGINNLACLLIMLSISERPYDGALDANGAFIHS